MESTVVFVLILATVTFETAPTYGQTIYASENPLPVGSNVTLFSQTKVTAGAWSFKSDMIVMTFPGGILIAENWKDRITFNSTDSSLSIRSLQVTDSGLYTLQQMTGNTFSAELTLSVQEPISNVALTANATNLVEFNDTVVLTCSVSNGSSLSYVWMNGSSVVTAGGGVRLSDGNATLTIVGVTRYDQGPFSCNVSNGISHNDSLPVQLNISYGPSNTTMMIMPSKYMYRAGSGIILWCSAESSPSATVQWMFNGTYLNQYGPQLRLENVSESQSGNYQCIFHNTVTSRFASASATIRILNPVAAAVVNHEGGPAILYKSFSMLCQVSGPADEIQWWRNGRLISADNSTIFGMGNKTLTLNPVQHSDNGDYQCQAFNYVSNMTSSPYKVEVNYGPSNQAIAGPSMGLTGTQVTLNCSSNSYPPSNFSWYYNNSLVGTTSKLAIGPLTFNMAGKYICMAFNNVTGKNSTASTTLTVLAPVTMASIKTGGQPIMNHTFNLTCETAGGVESVIWMHGLSPVRADGMKKLSMDNATLTFDPVMTSENGMYECIASNPLTSVRSTVYKLDVFYGPEMPVITGPTLAKTGFNAILSCHASSNPLSAYKWFFNGSLVANVSEYITPPLSRNLSGMYTCMAFNNITGKNSTVNKMFSFVDPIVAVQIDAPMNRAIEGHSYDLTCNVTGPAVHVYWMKNNEPLHKDNRITLSMDNKTLTFNPLEYNDTGNYECKAFNTLWNMTSRSYNLLMDFGPQTPMIGGPAFAETGHKAVFNCSAKSMPPSRYSWWFNGSEVANTSVFTTSLLSFNLSGEYTCVAYNNVTGKNSTTFKMLTVIEAIKSVTIKSNTVPIVSKNFTLTCEVVGPYDTIYWMKNGMKLTGTGTPNATMFYHIINNSLHFTSLTVPNDGEYQCVATNRAGQTASHIFTLQVNYGPVLVTITGPNSATVGTLVSLGCSAFSQPNCDFYWFFNNQTSVLHTGSTYTFVAYKSTEGNYTCEAKNPVTNSTMSQTQAFTWGNAAALHIPSQAGVMLMGLFALSVTVMFN